MLTDLREGLGPQRQRPIGEPRELDAAAQHDAKVRKEFVDACELAREFALRVVEDLQSFSPRGALGGRLLVLGPRLSLERRDELEDARKAAVIAAEELGELAEDMFDMFDAGVAMLDSHGRPRTSVEDVTRELGL